MQDLFACEPPVKSHNQLSYTMLRNCNALTLALIAVAIGGAVAQMVAEAPGPAVLTTMPEAPLMQSGEAMCIAKLGGLSQTLIMVADPGDFTGTGEAVHFLANLEDRVNVTSSSYCLSTAHGTIMGQPVAVIASGIGPGTAALCLMEILQCSDYIKEIIWSGTAGYSAQPGGILDTTRGCGAANPSTVVTREGDLCITPFAINWDCKLTDWDQQCAGFPNVCSYPTQTYGPDSAFLYGDCIFSSYTAADLDLTMEVQAAAEAAKFPARSNNLNMYEELYFNITSNSTGVAYNLTRPPIPWNYTQCAIADSQFFWAGAPWDMVSRNFSATLINEALGMSLTQTDVVTVSSMEDEAVAQVVGRWNAMSTTKQIPYVMVRTHSDFLQKPVVQTGEGMWETSPDALPQNFEDGYPYAIATGSTAVLTTLERRCRATNGIDHAICQYTLANIFSD